MVNPLYPGKASHSAAASTSSVPYTPKLRGGSFSSSSASKPSKPSASAYDPSFHPGILNLGNTCFLNSVIQAIANTRDFRLLIQGPDADQRPASLAPPPPSSNRHPQWLNRDQSPALRVSDNEHGRRIDHPPNPNGSLDSSLASIATLPAQDPAATIKPPKHSAPLDHAAPPSTRATPDSSAAPPYEPDVLDLPLNTAFRHVLEKFWSDAHKSRSSINVNPKRLLTQLGKKYDQYLEYGQQDGHELMRHLLDACRMEELDLIKKMRPRPASSDAPNTQLVTLPAGTSPVAPGAPPTDDDALLPFLDLLFCGKLASMVVCEGCKKVSHTYEDFYDISLSLRDDDANPKSRRRDRLRSMADRWRRATQGRTIMDRKSAAAATAAASNSETPVGTPRYSENDTSDADSTTLQRKKSANLLSPDEPGRGRFQLRARSLRKSAGRHEKLGATSGSEMEPDFPDMASLSLAPSGVSRPYVDSAPASAGEDNGDARTGTRVARMLGSARPPADASSRETSPNTGADRSAAPTSAAGMRPSLRATKSSSHQSAYISRIMADDPTTPANSAASRKAGTPSPLFDAVSAAASAQGKPLHGLFRSVGAHPRSRDPCADFEPDPHSRGAKRRQKVRQDQADTGLIGSLRQFTSVEVLDGDNSFACKNCWRLANPPNAQEREQIRRRRRRKGAQAADVEDDDASEPSSSDADSDRDKSTKAPVGDATLTGPPSIGGVNGTRITSSTSQSTLANSSVDSIMTSSSASLSSHQRSDIPTISMTSADASADSIDLTLHNSIGGVESVDGVIARDYAKPSGETAAVSRPSGPDGVMTRRRRDSGSSLSSVEAAAQRQQRTGLAPNNGYDTGTETDMSGFSTGMDESNASTGEGTDTDEPGAAGNEATAKRASGRDGPKRSAQSLPRRALKRYLIASAPPVMIFHLKRFQATGRGFVSGLAGFKKIDDQITFPEYLDITPWLAPPREEYDRRGRLKASSDPLAIRRRAEEEATNAGVDARNVRVEVSGVHGRGSRHAHHADKKGRRHGMWSWHLHDNAKHPRGAHGVDAKGGDLDEGPKVQSSAGHEIVPSIIRRPKTEYRLYAVIVHQGSLSAGHYTAYVLSDRIKLKEGHKELVARSAPTSRTNTPAPPGSSIAAGSSKDMGGLGQFFLGGSRPARNGTSSPAPVPVRPASAAPAASVAMTSVASTTSLGKSSVSGGSSHDIAPQTSISSLEDGSVSSAVVASGSGSESSVGPKLVRPRPQLKPMASWDSLDELEQSHATGAATPTSATVVSPSSLEPAPAVPTVASQNSNAHRHVEPATASDNDDDVDPRKHDDGRRWVYTSDTIVRAATIDEVLKAKAYMLFYERI
ncbi:hypothetical protein PANT_7d00344 [Moesziomyces antarcticus T-34]|uniref:ubiquitinyl hydrolase 1 n=1 Tax=Pseudozyma antarctica (strain T-34) TaxID=1151754 RepID=M9LMR1_PSEA3|nr:hypothetical protein PANT_7d00344 [Moesziomyces antarcticus T-34]